MEKIEQVARAILSKVPTGYGMTASEAEDYARAAIEAMREPTEAMIPKEGVFLWRYQDSDADQEEARAAWQAMIDAALKEGAE